jgi:diguanylate cyclase
MDPVALATSAIAVGSVFAACHMWIRATRAEAKVASLGRELEAERYAASHDSLTGLPNRRAFYQLGVTLINESARQPLVAVVIDLDDFKQINDQYGHAAGDQVLVAIAQRFAEFAGDNGDNLVARLGGDEFAGLLRVPTVDGSWLDQFARRLTEALAAPIQIVGRTVQVTASVGLAPVAGCHLAEALRHADAAMYRVKGAAPNDRLPDVPEELTICRPRMLASHS